MPLQNRVNPFGELFASPARGSLFGNRGGRFHTDAKTLTARRWASRQWICCVLDFKDRRRNVWGRFYTELFFLDEPTALAAGHRPCFECRRKDAETFAEAWRKAKRLRARPYADAMDTVLHDERLDGRTKRLHRREIDTLPDGAFIAQDAKPSRSAATRCCTGRLKVTTPADRAGAASLLTCSRRRRSWRRCRRATAALASECGGGCAGNSPTVGSESRPEVRNYGMAVMCHLRNKPARSCALLVGKRNSRG